jgi:N-acyl-phosphatidylethanolamine-hydrolysing phospholipase D
VPIGAYAPRRLEAPFHVDPEQAAEIARIVGADIAIGIHWGTFALSEEAPVEQRARFLAASGRGVIARVPRVGETIILRR